jgi:hypothetical protein
MLAFVHIPKTAGTTLHKIICHQYSRIIIRHDTDGPPDQEWADCVSKKKPEVIMGHLSANLHQILPEVRYVTCLRDPIARITSHYHHSLNDPTHYLHSEVINKKLDLAAYAASGISGELNNGMTRMIAGIDDFHHSQVNEETLAQAKHNIETHFDGVILSEEFDRGLMLLADSLKWKTPYYLRRKVGRYPSSTSKGSKSAYHIIREHNRFDCELYEWAKQRLKHQQSLTENLNARIACFQKHNRIKGKVIFCLRELRCRLHAP